MNLATDRLYNSVEGDRLLKTLKFRFTTTQLNALKKELFGVTHFTVECSMDKIVKKAVLKKISVNKFLTTCVKILPGCKEDIMVYIDYRSPLKKSWKFTEKIKLLTKRHKCAISTLLMLQDWRRFAMCCGYNFWEVRKWDSEKTLVDKLVQDGKDLFDIYYVAREMGMCSLFKYIEQIAEEVVKH